MIKRNPSHRVAWAALTFGLLYASRATAQATLLPGSSTLVTASLAGTSGGMRVLQTPRDSTTAHELASVQFERRLVPHVADRGNAPGILMLYHGQAGGTSYVDSSMFMLHGLAPVWEVWHFQGKTSRYTYDGGHVSVVSTSPDSGERRLEHTYPVPVFMWQQRSELMSALPLETGYRAIVPLYSEGDLALEMDTVQVVGVNSAQRWTVRFADPVIVATFEIDGRTRAITAYSHTFRKSGDVMRWVVAPQTLSSNRS